AWLAEEADCESSIASERGARRSRLPRCGIHVARQRQKHILEIASGELRPVGDDLIEGAVRDGSAMMNDEELRAQLLDEMQQMRAEDDRHAGARAGRDRLAHP